MASLANQTISSTYDGLIKTSSDNAVPVSGVQALEDGSGNALALSVGRSGNGVTVSGNLAVDTNTLYVDAANNRVGIGTSSPSTIINAAATDNTIIRLESTDTTPSADQKLGGVEFYGNGSTLGAGVYGSLNGFYEDTAGRSYLTLSTRTSTGLFERMRIDSGGNVGIGVVPDTKLDVLGNLRVRRAVASTQYTEIESGGGLSIIRGKNNASSLYQALIFESGNNTTTEERMRIDSSGNVGIGVTPSSYNGVAGTKVLAIGGAGNNGVNVVSGNTSSGSYMFSDLAGNDRGGMIYYHTADLLDIHTAGVQRMRIDSSGNITQTASDASLSVNASNAGGTASISINGLGSNGSSTAGTRIDGIPEGSAAAASMAFVTREGSGSRTEKMRITSGGNVLIGTQGIPNGTSIYGSGFISGSDDRRYLNLATSGTVTREHIQFFNPNGKVGTITTNASSTAYNTSSDYRLKENVVEMTGALDRVDALKPSRFNFIADPEKTVDGFIAHEVQAIVPEAVTGEKDAVDEEGNPIYQGIDQSKIVPLLVGAIQELKAEIELLKSQING